MGVPEAWSDEGRAGRRDAMSMVPQLGLVQKLNCFGVTLGDEEELIGEPAAFIPLFERKHGLNITEFPAAPMVLIAGAICEKKERANKHRGTGKMPASIP